MTREERNAYHRTWYAKRDAVKAAQDRERNNAQARAKYAEDPVKSRADSRERKHRDIEWSRLRERLREHGLTLDQYAAKDEAQDWMCAICAEEKQLDIDHNHDTNQRRGLLCGDCNRGIGLLREDVSRFATATRYIEKWSTAVA